jgi:phage baseplate assembly protein gpV
MNFLERMQQDSNEQRREQRIFGVLVAKVTGRMADGTYELNYLSMGKNAPSAPARMMASMAGRQRGTYFMPEVGDEVVVGFEAGDSNAPIILGGLWNAASPPPSQARADEMSNDVRTIVSRSGHEITLDDKAEMGAVKVKTRRGHTLEMEDMLPGKVTLRTAGGISITMDDATGTLTLAAPTMIVLAAPGVALAAGGISLAPSVPTTPPAPGEVSLNAPLVLHIESTAINVKAATIGLTTTGVPGASLVAIEGRPFTAHTHLNTAVPPVPMTGPVTP